MNHLRMQLQLSRRRQRIFYGMRPSTSTLHARNTNNEDGQNPPVEIDRKSQDEERGGIDGKSTTGESSDPTANSADSAGQGDARQDTVHADGQADNSIQPKPD